MAEIQNLSGNKNKRQKKLSTRVDLTPMVDLGFLLITFFIFTSTLSQITTLRLVMPKDNGKDSMLVAQTSALSILLSKDNSIYYYVGSDYKQIKRSNFKDIRQVIIDRKRTLKADELFVLIKPTANALYGNTIDILNEMTINDVAKYAISDVNEQERTLLKAIGGI